MYRILRGVGQLDLQAPGTGCRVVNKYCVSARPLGRYRLNLNKRSGLFACFTHSLAPSSGGCPWPSSSQKRPVRKDAHNEQSEKWRLRRCYATAVGSAIYALYYLGCCCVAAQGDVRLPPSVLQCSGGATRSQQLLSVRVAESSARVTCACDVRV